MSTNERNDTESQWLQYVANLNHFDAFAVDSSARIELVDRLSGVLFSKTTQLSVLEASDSSEIVRSTVENEEEMNVFARRKSDAKVEIISISQETSLSPLNISKSSLFKLLQRYQVSPDFFDVVCGFGNKKLSSDESCIIGPYNTLDGSVYEISYQLNYVERKPSRGNPWTLRQTGVYHKYSSLGDRNPTNTWILLHPKSKSKVYQRIEKVTSAEIGTGCMGQDSLRLHLLLFSSYLDNWRHYLHDMTRECLDLQDRLMTSELHDEEEYTTLNFETMQTLRHMAGKLIPIPAILRASIKTVAAVKTMNNILSSQPGIKSSRDASRDLFKTSSQLSSFEVRLQSYLAGCLVLQARIENMTKFLADGLNLKNQEVAVKSNGHLVTLTKDTISDNATVRAVTLVTLIYLPATFMSGMFGSNLFAFSSDTWHFEMSPQIWIYFVATIPLTIITLGYWKYKTNQQRNKKKKEEEEAEAAKQGMQNV